MYVAHAARARARLFFVGLAVAAAPYAAAQESKALNVYTYREPGLVKPLFDDFEKRTGIAVKAIFASQGLEERIRAEGRSSPADVLLVTDISRLVNAAKTGLAQPVSSPEIEAAIPAPLRDPERLWVALTMRARIVYASKARVADTTLQYEDLAQPRWKGKICLRSGQHPYNIGLAAAMISHVGEAKTLEWLKGLKSNLAKKPSGGDRDVAKDIAAGLCDIGLANTYYLGGLIHESDATKRAWAEPIRAIMPNFVGGGTHVNISGAVVAKYAPNQANAVRFLEYMLSEEAQRLYAAVNYEYPVRAGVPVEPTVKSFGELKPDATPLADIARLSVRASELIDEVAFDQ